MFYYLIEETVDKMIVRAAQPTLSGAMRYSDGSPKYFVAGPMDSETLHKLFPLTN